MNSTQGIVRRRVRFHRALSRKISSMKLTAFQSIHAWLLNGLEKLFISFSFITIFPLLTVRGDP